LQLTQGNYIPLTDTNTPCCSTKEFFLPGTRNQTSGHEGSTCNIQGRALFMFMAGNANTDKCTFKMSTDFFYHTTYTNGTSPPPLVLLQLNLIIRILPGHNIL
jgi:hypothetical protein